MCVVMGLISGEWVERILTPIRKSVIAPSQGVGVFIFKGLGLFFIGIELLLPLTTLSALSRRDNISVNPKSSLHIFKSHRDEMVFG